MSTPEPRPTVVTSPRSAMTSPPSSMRRNGVSTRTLPSSGAVSDISPSGYPPCHGSPNMRIRSHPGHVVTVGLPRPGKLPADSREAGAWRISRRTLARAEDWRASSRCLLPFTTAATPARSPATAPPRPRWPIAPAPAPAAAPPPPLSCLPRRFGPAGGFGGGGLGGGGGSGATGGAVAGAAGLGAQGRGGGGAAA